MPRKDLIIDVPSALSDEVQKAACLARGKRVPQFVGTYLGCPIVLYPPGALPESISSKGD